MKARLEAHGVEVLGITDHHIFHSIYFFDPNGVRLELTAQLADEFQMLEESKTAHARLAEWTARKEQWRKDRAAGKAAEPLKPQKNDRPEIGEKIIGVMPDSIRHPLGAPTMDPGSRMTADIRDDAKNQEQSWPRAMSNDFQQRLRIHAGQRLQPARVPVRRTAGNRSPAKSAITPSSSSAAVSPA